MAEVQDGNGDRHEEFVGLRPTERAIRELAALYPEDTRIRDLAEDAREQLLIAEMEARLANLAFSHLKDEVTRRLGEEPISMHDAEPAGRRPSPIQEM